MVIHPNSHLEVGDTAFQIQRLRPGDDDDDEEASIPTATLARNILTSESVMD
jgi:hypothetical protein